MCEIDTRRVRLTQDVWDVDTRCPYAPLLTPHHSPQPIKNNPPAAAAAIACCHRWHSQTSASPPPSDVAPCCRSSSSTSAVLHGCRLPAMPNPLPLLQRSLWPPSWLPAVHCRCARWVRIIMWGQVRGAIWLLRMVGGVYSEKILPSTLPSPPVQYRPLPYLLQCLV
jgi:hypothetical protein